MAFSFKAFASYQAGNGNGQSSDLPSVKIPSQQASWPTRQYFDAEKNNSPIGVMDKIFSGDAWLEPKMYMVRNEKKDFSPRKIFQDKYTREWKAKERTDREVVIGNFELVAPLFVNPRGPTIFNAFYVEMIYEEKTYPISLTQKEFDGREVLPRLSFFRRNPDCPDKYLVAAFFLAVQELTDVKFLITPERAGWYKYDTGELIFASSESILSPCLAQCYAEDIRKRKLVKTDRALVEIAREYAEALPKGWQYKLLVVIRLASLLLYFIEEEGVRPDHLFVVEPASPSAAKIAVALLKTQCYDSQVVTSLMSTKSQLNEAIRNANDGMLLLNDNARVENSKKHDELLQVVVDDLHSTNGVENPTRHLTAILCENPSLISEDVPAMFIELIEKVNKGNPGILQQLSGEFDSGLIRSVLNDPINWKQFINEAISISKVEIPTISSSENYNSKRLVRFGLEFAKKYNLVTSEECKSILQWLKNGYEQSRDTATSIVNDIRKVLNDLLFNHLKVVSQYGIPYYVIGKNMVFVDDDYINFEVGVWDRLLIQMKTTKKRLKALHALDTCKMIYSNNGLKRNLEVEVAPDVNETVSVYSLSKKLLNTANREKIDLSDKVKFLLNYIELEKNKILPLGVAADGSFIGKDISFENKSNDHILITGQSGSGKTFCGTNLLPSLAMLGSRMLVCDVSDSFPNDEVLRALPAEVVDALFEFIEVAAGKRKLPVNPLFIGDCTGLPAKKRRIVGFIKAIAGKLDKEETRKLTGIISDMLKRYPNITSVTIEMLRNALKRGGKFGNHVYSLISSTLDDIDTIGFEERGWSEFFEESKRIPVLSFGNESGDNVHSLLDAIISSAFEWQRLHNASPLSIVIDELKDQNFAEGSPLHTILTQGRKFNTRFVGMTQQYISTSSHAIDVAKEAGIKIFFRPAKSLDRIANDLGYKNAANAGFGSMGIGDIILCAELYNKIDGVNEPIVIHAKAIKFIDTPLYGKFQKEYGIK